MHTSFLFLLKGNDAYSYLYGTLLDFWIIWEDNEPIDKPRTNYSHKPL